MASLSSLFGTVYHFYGNRWLSFRKPTEINMGVRYGSNRQGGMWQRTAGSCRPSAVWPWARTCGPSPPVGPAWLQVPRVGVCVPGAVSQSTCLPQASAHSPGSCEPGDGGGVQRAPVQSAGGSLKNNKESLKSECGQSLLHVGLFREAVGLQVDFPGRPIQTRLSPSCFPLPSAAFPAAHHFDGTTQEKSTDTQMLLCDFRGGIWLH